MAVSAIKPLYSSVSAFTITVASLANSTAGVGRQSTLIDNSSNRYKDAIVTVSIKLGTSPTANTAVYVYAIGSDKNTTAIRDDGAGASDAAWTQKSAGFLLRPDGTPSILRAGAAPATGDVLKGAFLFQDLPPEWGIGVVNSTGVALDSTGGNHVLSWIGVLPEAQ